MKQSNLFKEALKHLPSGVNSPVRAFGAVGGTPVFMKRGRGAFVYDESGKRYLDFCLSWGPLIFGHAPAGLVKALQREVKNGTSFGAATKKETELAQLIKKAFPSIEKVRLVSSGTEAVMSAIRLARGVTGRKKILKIEGGYHGHVDSLLVRAGSGGATFGIPDSLGVPEELAKLTITVPFNHFEALHEIFRREGRRLAAFILEPVPANMGVVLPKPGYLKEVRSLTKKYGVLLIFDEVITGFRLAQGGAQERFSIEPDLTCLGKILGGGLPLAAFGGKSKWMDELVPEGKVYQAGTLSGNPLAARAAIWTLQKLIGSPPTPALERKSENFYGALKDRIRHFRWPVRLNALGSMFTIFFGTHPVDDFRSAQLCDTRLFAQFFHGALEKGIYLAPSQFEANFVSTAHTEQDLRRAVTVFERVLRKIF
ncbi:MAG: glutamate-1-semialdehyde 2,1-aminomutase [Candidatus Omnitrophica bacterium]|nr:glutamate-1-semialdehyde 2,1-aminomutase [Candidatus Omnitrophota bacterium]